MSYNKFISKHLGIWLITVLGLSLSISAYVLIEKQVREYRDAEFSWVAHNHNNLVVLGIKNVLNLIHISLNNYKSLKNPSLSALGQISTSLVNTNISIDSIALLNVKTALSQRTEFNIHIETIIQNKDSYLAACISEGMPDLIHTAISAADKTGQTQISKRIPCLNNTQKNYAVMVIYPLNTTLTKHSEKQSKQFAGVLIKLKELTSLAISHLEPRGVDLLIQDESNSKGIEFLKYYASRLNPNNSFEENTIQQKFITDPRKIVEQIKLLNISWSITAIPTENFRSAQAYESQALIVLIAGVVMTIWLTFYLFHIKRGIKERTEMGELLREREELFWQMTETVDDLFWAINIEDSHFLYISQAYEKIWGLKCSLTYHHPQLFIEGIYPEDRQIWQNGIHQVKETGQACEVYYRINQSNGSNKNVSIRWIKDNMFPVKDSAGKIYRLVGVAEDITEKKKAEDLLRDSEQRLRTLFKQSPDTIMTVDRNGSVLLTNQGISLETTAIKRDSAKLFPHQYRDKYLELLDKAFNHAEVSYLPYQPEVDTWYEIRLVPIIEQQQINTVMVISTDVTEKQLLEAQAIHNSRLAYIGTMATGVAHDINNPNNAINTAATLLGHICRDAVPVFREYQQEHGDFSLGGLSFASDGESLSFLSDEIAENSRRITAIINNLKQLGQADQGDFNEKVNLNTVLQNAEKMLKSNIEKYTSHWQINLAEGEPFVQGNFRQLEQVIINIVLNALQSLPDKGCAVLLESRFCKSEFCKSESGESNIEIRISDEGVGIKPENMSQVTEPFFTTRQENGGTGLGLYLSQLIISKHKGQLNINSNNKGTTICIILPAYNLIRNS